MHALRRRVQHELLVNATASHFVPSTYSIYRGLADEATGSSWKGWLKSKVPAALGGDKDAELNDLTLDGAPYRGPKSQPLTLQIIQSAAFSTNLKRARQLGGLTGFVHGTSNGGDPSAIGTLRLFENIINAMQTHEKEDLSNFNSPARQRVASQVGCTTSQVDDCIARYLWMRKMGQKVQELKAQGKPMPTSITEVEQMLGSWRSYKSEATHSSNSTLDSASGDTTTTGGVVPLDQMGPKNQPCPLAGSVASKNTKCTLTRKAYKACCGKTLLKASAAR